jgi:acyl-CoA thioester hydrolase
MTTKALPHKNFSWQMRVYWQDTDAGGIVYHPNYLNFAQRARSEYMRAHVCKESDVQKKFGVLLVARHAEIDYHASARLDDLIDVSVEIAKIGNSSLAIHQHITREGLLLATVKITIVTVSAIGKATRIPPQLRQILGE